MVKVERLIKPDDRFRSTFPGLGFRDVCSLSTAGEKVLITDPVYIADVYNSTDPAAMYLKRKGVLLGHFGGDVHCPIWWQSPYLLLPMSSHLPDDLESPHGVDVLAKDVHTDSGSFVFMPLTGDLPKEVSRSISVVLREGNGVALKLPGGKWDFYYEQWRAPCRQLVGLYRNIAVRHWPASNNRVNRSARNEFLNIT